jgi:hypothetical protein
MATHKNRHREDSRTAGPLAGVRAFVGPAFVIGGWQIMSFSNVAGLVIVYFGFLLCLAECTWEPELLRRPYQLQIVLIGAAFALVAMFTILVVGVQAPLEIFATGNNAEYPSGELVGDIAWNTKFYPLRISINNPSTHDYNDVDFVIRPDKPITKITQISGFCRIHFEDNLPTTEDLAVISTSGGVTALSPALLAADSGYRARCDTLPAHSAVEIVAAVVSG